MPSYRSDPVLWGHLAGIFLFPALMLLCLLILAGGDSLGPLGLERTAVAALGSLPIVWMQVARPLNVFSLLAVTQPSSSLSDDRRRVLAVMQEQQSGWMAAAIAALMVLFLQNLYELSPLLTDLSPIGDGAGASVLRFGLATVVFFLANLSIQIPLSVLRVIVTAKSRFEALTPVAETDVSKQFLLIGLAQNQVLGMQPEVPEDDELEPDESEIQGAEVEEVDVEESAGPDDSLEVSSNEDASIEAPQLAEESPDAYMNNEDISSDEDISLESSTESLEERSVEESSVDDAEEEDPVEPVA